MKYKRIFIELFISLLFSQIIYAQFPQDIPYQSIQPPVVNLPNYLESITDTSVPEDILVTRITEYVSDWNWYPTHEYAKIQPWNADASVYKFHSVAIYNADSHQMIRELPGDEIYPSYWSNINPEIMHVFRENGDIKTYNIDTEVITTLNHIYFDDDNQTDYDIVKLGPYEGNIDKNDKYCALIGKKDTDLFVIIFDLELNQLVHTELFAGAWGNNSDDAPKYIDWVSVSQSGNYVGILWNNETTSQANPFYTHYGVEIYNTTDMQYLRRIAAYGGHGDFGFATNGDEVFVQLWGEAGTVTMYYLDRMEQVVLSTHWNFDGEGHVSCRNINRPGYAYVSQDGEYFSGQIIAFKLDDSGLVEHFGHHFSSASSYLKSPMPVPTPNGDKIMFKSDFGDTTSDVIYVFESKIKNITSVLSLKIFLEGAYNSSTHLMSTNLSNDIPLTSPYQEDARSVSSISPNIVDWVLVQLRTTPDGNTITSHSAFLHKDGRIVADDGTSGEIELNAPEGDYYIVIKHRNHLSVMSANTIHLNKTSSTLYDFTTGSDKFYGTGGAKQLE